MAVKGNSPNRKMTGRIKIIMIVTVILSLSVSLASLLNIMII